VGNQFSKVRLYPNRVFVRVHEREGGAGVYQPRAVAVHRLTEATSEAIAVVRADTHRREWTVRRGGIAEVDITLQSVESDGLEVPLAIVNHPSGGVRIEDVTWDRGSRAAEEEYLGGGRHRYTFNAARPRYDRIAWRYYVGNAVTLDQAEFQFREQRPQLFPNLRDGWDTVSHVARIEAERLELALKFLPECGGELGQIEAQVERLVEIRGEQTWERVLEEERRCVLTRPAAPTPETPARLAIEAPTIGYRYSLCYQPARSGQTLGASTSQLARSVLEKCRGTYQSTTSLGDRLTRAVASSLAEALGVDRGENTGGGPVECVLGAEAAWIGLLWDDKERRLLPAFGQFPTDSWVTTFATGSGVAGHSFRFSQPVFWYQGATRNTDVIYQSPRPDTNYRSYLWIMSFPLEVAPGGPAVGVISLSGPERKSPIGDRLFQCTEAMVAPEGPPETTRQFVDHLATLVNAAFWTTLSKYPLTRSDLAEVRRVIEALFAIDLVSPDGAGEA
jgi:hypothetical protein